LHEDYWSSVMAILNIALDHHRHLVEVRAMPAGEFCARTRSTLFGPEFPYVELSIVVDVHKGAERPFSGAAPGSEMQPAVPARCGAAERAGKGSRLPARVQ
jgi:hypothetical protein